MMVNKKSGIHLAIACAHCVLYIRCKNLLTHKINIAQVHTCLINTNICSILHLLDGVADTKHSVSKDQKAIFT